MPFDISQKYGYIGVKVITYRQTGHVPLDFSQGIMQGSWKGCLQGRVTTICSSGSSVSSLNCSLHTAQSLSSNGASDRNSGQ